MRILPVLFSLALSTLTMAQPPLVGKEYEVLIPVTLTPRALPKPLSNYYLQVEYGELQPGDKLSGFLKCFMEQDRFYSQAEQEKRLKWLDGPLKDLPESTGVENGIGYAPKYAGMMVMMDQAARYNRIEWNEYFNLRNDGASMLLPEVQKLRALGQVLHLRLRTEIKKQDFDKAVITVRTLFGLARLLESHPTVIGNLVGLAVANHAVQGLEELIVQPGCPSLYWSFADLPTPFFSLRTGISGERLLMKSEFKNCLPDNRAMTEQDIAETGRKLKELGGASGSQFDWNELKLMATITLRTADVKLMDLIRVRLKADKVDAGVIQAMPKVQLLFLEDAHRYELLRDETFKWINRPFPEASKGMREVDALLKREREEGWLLSPLLLPALSKSIFAQVRLEQRLASLMTLEALRLHAHGHAGKLPEALSDIGLTVPNDPVSGKSFEYSTKDGVATLKGANPSGLPSDNRRYVIRMAK